MGRRRFLERDFRGPARPPRECFAPGMTWRDLGAGEIADIVQALVPSRDDLSNRWDIRSLTTSAILDLIFAAHLIAVRPKSTHARAAEKVIRNAARVTGGEDVPSMVAMDLLRGISSAASPSGPLDLHELCRRELAIFRSKWPVEGRRVDFDKMLEAAAAWRASDKRRGPISKWKPAFAAVKGARIRIKSEEALKTLWFSRQPARSIGRSTKPKRRERAFVQS